MKHDAAALGNLIYQKGEYSAIRQAALEIVNCALDNPDNFAQIFHPLGFLQIKLGEAGSLGTVKLHIWHPLARRPHEPPWFIHLHKWDLTSFIIMGEVTNELYSVTSSTAEEATNCLYAVRFTEGSSILSRTDEFVVCQLSSQQSYPRGHTYDVPIDRFHSTVVAQQAIAVTAILTPAAKRPSPKVVGSINGAKTYPYDRIPCPRDVFLKVIADVRSRLG